MSRSPKACNPKRGLVKYDITGSSACAISIPLPVFRGVWSVLSGSDFWCESRSCVQLKSGSSPSQMQFGASGEPGRSREGYRVTFDSDSDRLGMTRPSHFLVQILTICDVQDRRFRDFLVGIKWKIRLRNTSRTDRMLDTYSIGDVVVTWAPPLVIFGLWFLKYHSKFNENHSKMHKDDLSGDVDVLNEDKWLHKCSLLWSMICDLSHSPTILTLFGSLMKTVW